MINHEGDEDLEAPDLKNGALVLASYHNLGNLDQDMEIPLDMPPPMGGDKELKGTWALCKPFKGYKIKFLSKGLKL